jgi:hypothetical protein
MSIGTATLIASAVQTGLMIIFGLWIKHFVDQQIKSKEAAIQALESALKSKDAVISRLEQDSAPAVAAAYQQMKSFADSVAQSMNELEMKLASAEAGRKGLDASIQNQILAAKRGVAQAFNGSFLRHIREMQNPQKPFYDGKDLMNLLAAVIADMVVLAKTLT